jgi:hypothetical protein
MLIKKVLMRLSERIKAFLTAERTTAAEWKAKYEATQGLLDAAIAKGSADSAELAEIKATIDELQGVNLTPVSDAVINDVVADPEIETPAAITEAPAPTPEAIPDATVVDAAIDALMPTE